MQSLVTLVAAAGQRWLESVISAPSLVPDILSLC